MSTLTNSHKHLQGEFGISHTETTVKRMSLSHNATQANIWAYTYPTTVDINPKQQENDSQAINIFEALKNTEYYDIAIKLHVYMPPLIILFGLTGNVLALLVSLQKHNRKRPFCKFMGVLAISDIGFILSGMIFWGFSFTNGTTDLVCKLTLGFSTMFSLISSWIIILMTIDRLVLTVFPMKGIIYNNSKYAVYSMVLVCIVSACFIWCVLQFSIESTSLSPGPMSCGVAITSNLLSRVVSPLYSALQTFVPFVLLVVMNTVILYSLRKSNKRILKVMYPKLDDDESNAGENKTRTSIIEESKTGTSDAGESKTGTSDAGESKAGTSDVAENMAGTRDVAENMAGTSDVAENMAGTSDVAENMAGTRDAAGENKSDMNHSHKIYPKENQDTFYKIPVSKDDNQIEYKPSPVIDRYMGCGEGTK